MRIRTGMALGVVALLCGCGGRPLEQEIEKHPANVLPQGVSQVFYFRMDRLRENPLAALAYQQSRVLDLGPSLKGTSQTLRLAGPLTRLVVGAYSAAGQGQPSAVAVATGKFDEKAFVQSLEAAGIPSISGRHENLSYYTCGRGGARCHVAFPSPQLVVAASQEDLLKRTVDLSRHPAKNLANDRAFAPLLETFSPEMDLWATGSFPSGLAGIFGPQVQPAVEMIQAFTIKLTGAKAKRFGLILHCANGEAAQANANVLKVVVGQLAQNAVEAGYPIEDLLRAIQGSQIAVDGTKADFELELTAAEIAATAQVFRTPPAARPAPPMMLMDMLPPERK